MSARRRRRMVTAAVWCAVTAGAAYLAYRRYAVLEGVVPTGPGGAGGDFWVFLHGSRLVAAGHGLYASAEASKTFYGYVYTPLVAVLLLPFASAATVDVWHVWTAVSIAALVLAGARVAGTAAPSLSSWRRPVLVGFTTVTALEFVATKVELSQGQVDTFVLLLLAVAVALSARGRAVATGVLLGVGGLIKTWPALAGLAMAGRGFAGRRRAVGALVVTVALGPVLAAAVAGASGVGDFVRTTFDARSQHLLSHSVWGTPLVLFSHSGLAHPVVDSAPIRYLATVVLEVWVLGLLVLTLRRAGTSVLAFWHIVACVVLLLPVSHSVYTLYLLPLLWIWAGRWLAEPRLRGAVPVVAGLLVLWWLVLFHTNWSPLAEGSPSESSVRISVLFFANLAAVTASVLGQTVGRDGRPLFRRAAAGGAAGRGAGTGHRPRRQPRRGPDRADPVAGGGAARRPGGDDGGRHRDRDGAAGGEEPVHGLRRHGGAPP